jgi:hypothetical protein
LIKKWRETISTTLKFKIKEVLLMQKHECKELEWVKVDDEQFANVMMCHEQLNNVYVLDFYDTDITTKARYDDGNKGYEVEIPTSPELWELVEEGKENE